MSLPAINTTQFAEGDIAGLRRQLNQFRGQIADFLARLQRNPRLDSVTQTVTLASLTTTKVNHKLDRQPQGWCVNDVTVATTIYRSAWDDRTITLYSSGAATVSLEVW